MGLTQDDETGNAHMSDIPLQLPASANAASNSVLVTFSHDERNVPSLHPIPSQTGVQPWQLQYPSTYPQVQQALNVQRETARRGSLHQQGELLAAAHQYEAAARLGVRRTDCL